MQSTLPIDRPLSRRIALATAALALVTMALLYGSIRLAATSTMTASLAAAVDTDLAGLADIYASGGKAELIARISDRNALISAEDRPARYMLVGTNEEILAGDIAVWPQLNPRLSEQAYVELADGTSVYARATQLAPDLKLLVAKDYRTDQAQLRALNWTFAIAASVVALAALLLGHVSSRWLLLRLDAIIGALQRGDGDALTSGRNPRAPRDEIDLLAETSGQLIARANRLAELHRQFSDHVAHEVRTPLMHLDNRLLDALRAETDATARQELLEKARKDIRGISGLLDSLLDIAASEARRGDPTGLTRFDLSALVHELVQLYQPSFEEAGLNLMTEVAPGVTMQGEQMQITRLLSNLLDNASKYVPTGGDVRVELHQGPQIIVCDNGPGIEAALRPHLFERFRRGAVHSPRGGHGLGLALARAIAERHGMRIRAEDNDPGTRFVIEPEPSA